MGRYKFDRFTGCDLSQRTIEAIKADLVNAKGIDIESYDWYIIDLRIKKADHIQRQRFADTIHKLEEYTRTPEAQSYLGEWWVRQGGIVRDFAISIDHCARITGRNRKTIMDWIDKEFLPVTPQKGLRDFILVNNSIVNLRKIKQNK